MRYCLMCGSSRWIERHHIFNGAYRKKSEKYGQLKAMSENGWTVEEFIKKFGKNYL